MGPGADAWVVCSSSHVRKIRPLVWTSQRKITDIQHEQNLCIRIRGKPSARGKDDSDGGALRGKASYPYLRSKGLLCANSGLEFLTMETHGGFHISHLNLKSHCKDQRPTDVLNIDCEVRRLEVKMKRHTS